VRDPRSHRIARPSIGRRLLRFARSLGFACLTGGAVAGPAAAQWTRVDEVPIANIYNVWTTGDTIAASSDSTVFVSFDRGVTWITTAKVAVGVTSIEAVRVHKGRWYAGTRGQGVFVSSDRGATWQSFNQGLVGGFANSQLVIMDLLIRGDDLYAATGGAGPWTRNLASAGGWSHYGNVLEPAQASNMESIAGSPTRLLACAGFNGDDYHRDLGDSDWTFDYLFGHVAAGLASLAAVWTGHSWLVGTNIGVFHSALGQSPWIYTDFGLHPTLFASFALHGGVVYTHFASGEGTGIEYSTDDGTSWIVLDALPATFTYNIATLGDTLYGGRVDGLWRRPIDPAPVSVPVADAPGSLHFAITGPNPIHDEARLRFELPEPGRVRIDVFDISGRHLPGGVDETVDAGAHEVLWRARDIAPGIYLARLSAGGRSAAVRLVRTR
jgi:hypothetical protein